MNQNINYIVSGLERSGTSLVMQILNAGEIPIAFDKIRKPDIHNPKGYYELEGGKIINKLIDGNFNFNKYKGKFIKITAYGLKFLPKENNYNIIFCKRPINEILDSMEKMSINKFNRKEMKYLLEKLLYICNSMILHFNWNVLYINYNSLIKNPDNELILIKNFLDKKLNIEKSKRVIDIDLYRNRTKNL